MKTPGRIVALAPAIAFLTVALFSIPSAQAGVWVGSGRLISGRYDHTATLLPNGKVLAAGGGANNGSFSSAELYDPVTRTWIEVGSMAEPRTRHTATLLPDGKVLVAGGASNGHISNGAELYDPATATWQVTGALATLRFAATATLLPNGKVLVAGGSTGPGFLSSAEQYDPATGKWAPAGFMTAARVRHTATLLPNGKVLVVGGIGLSSTDLYDPATGTWTPGGSMGTARYNHTATLLPNGKVLVTGGFNSAGTVVLSSSETYDPATGFWTAAGAMATSREGHTATLLPNGKVLVAGGLTSINISLTSRVELYEPATGTWFTNAEMATHRGLHTATLLPDGTVLAVGGLSDENGPNIAQTSTTELYVKARGIVTLGNLLQTYDGTPRSVTVTTAPPGLTVDLTYNRSPGAPINVGNYTVIGTINDFDYQGGATNTLVISKGLGTITLSNLLQIYDGTAKSVSFTTTPPGLAVVLTYDGSIVAPTNPGSYTVVGTIDDLNYSGSVTNTLRIGIVPVILSQPASRTNNSGTTATFSVLADGTPPLSYQWRKDGINYSDVNSPILTLTNVQKSDEGLYSVSISNAFGGVVSADARLTVNLPPIADAGATVPLLISVNGSNATAVLDGSRSHDPDGDSLQYTWFSSGSLLTNGVLVTVILPVGTNSITLSVSDGLATDSQTITVEVLTTAQAISRLIDVAGDAAAKQSLIATLRAALASLDRSNPASAINQLQAFQNQVIAQLVRIDPETAQALIEVAQSIIDAISGGTTPANLKLTLKGNFKTHLDFSGIPGQIYVIEASSDLVHWERIGVANDLTNGVFIFDDENTVNASARYYRVALP